MSVCGSSYTPHTKICFDKLKNVGHDLLNLVLLRFSTARAPYSPCYGRNSLLPRVSSIRAKEQPSSVPWVRIKLKVGTG